MAITVRPVEDADVPAMAAIRFHESHSEAFWANRIGFYLRGEHSPQQALPARTALVAVDESGVVGFVAGHLTRRFQCDGELQWVNVAEAQRGKGIAGRLLRAMGAWFVERQAKRICVNVAPENVVACRLYANHGALPLSESWMVWEDSRAMVDRGIPSGTGLL